MQRYTIYLYLETALHVSCGISTQSSGAHTTVSTESDTCKQVSDAVDTVVCAPDDGWRYHPKHVQQFQDINKLCNVASFWIYVEI